MRSQRVLLLVHASLVPPESLDGYTDDQIERFKAEYDVKTALVELGHDVRVLGLDEELAPLRTTLDEWKPHIAEAPGSKPGQHRRAPGSGGPGGSTPSRRTPGDLLRHPGQPGYLTRSLLRRRISAL